MINCKCPLTCDWHNPEKDYQGICKCSCHCKLKDCGFLHADECVHCLPPTKSEECKCRCHEGYEDYPIKHCIACQKQEEKGWEERFSQVWGGYNASEDTRGLDARIKDFIRQELSSVQSSYIRKVKEIRKCRHTAKTFEGVCSKCGDNRSNFEGDLGYNEALSDVLDLLLEEGMK